MSTKQKSQQKIKNLIVKERKMRRNKTVFEEVKVPDEFMEERFLPNIFDDYPAILDKEQNCWYSFETFDDILRLVYTLDAEIKILRVRNKDLKREIVELQKSKESKSK